MIPVSQQLKIIVFIGMQVLLLIIVLEFFQEVKI